MKRWMAFVCGVALAMGAAAGHGFPPEARAQSALDTEIPDYPVQPPDDDAEEILVFPEVKGTVSAKPLNGAPVPTLEKAGRLAKRREFQKAADMIAALPPTGENGQLAARAYVRGLALKELGQYAEAAALLRQAAPDQLLGDWALFSLMEGADAAGDAATLLTAADELFARFPHSPLAESALLLKAKLLKDTGLFAKAAVLLKELLGKGMRTPEKAYQLLAQCQEAMGEPRQAWTSWAAIWFNYPAAPFAEEAKAQMDRLKKESREFFPAASADDKMARVTALMQNRMYKEAEAYIKGLDKASFAPGHRAELYMHLGRAFERQGRKDDAVGAYLKAAKSNDRKLKGEALYRTARIYWNQDADEKTLAALAAVLKEAPGSDVAASANYVLARMDESAGRRPEAIRKFERTASVYPSSSVAEISLWYAGWLRFMDGDFAGAEAALQKLARRDEESSAAPMALYWEIRALQAQGKDFAQPLEKLQRKYPLSYYTLLMKGGDAISYQLPRDRPPLNDQVPETAVARIREGMARWAQKPALSEKGAWAYGAAQAWMRLGFTGRARDLLDRVAAETPGKREMLTWLAAQYYSAECYQCVFRVADAILKQDLEPEYLHFISLLIFPVAHWRAVASEAAANGIDPFLVLSVIRQESVFDPDIVSIADARGLMQIIPQTAERMAREKNMEGFTADQLHVPERNIALGAYYLAGLVKNENGELPLALATYNAGPNPVAKWKVRFPYDDAAVFVERIPYTETREYVKKVLRNYGLYRKVYLEQLGAARAHNRP